MNRICACKGPKIHNLTFDGGSVGKYTISVCKACHSDIDKEFLIREEKKDAFL